jgi:glycerate-2-kinase
LLAGGETTVTVKGSGTGGRSQEFVLAAALELHGERDVVIGSIGTDGVDGPTDAAGAIADGTIDVTGARASLHANDAYTFFRDHGGLIITGPTGTNVMDVMVAVISG